jgi:hypothetical protein
VFALCRLSMPRPHVPSVFDSNKEGLINEFGCYSKLFYYHHPSIDYRAWSFLVPAFVMIIVGALVFLFLIPGECALCVYSLCPLLCWNDLCNTALFGNKWKGFLREGSEMGSKVAQQRAASDEQVVVCWRNQSCWCTSLESTPSLYLLFRNTIQTP